MSSSAPPNIQIFPAESQFNGQATAYLDGTLARPTVATPQEKIVTTKAADGTETTVTTSSIQRERHTAGIIFHNIINPKNYSVNAKDTAAKTWKSLISQFDGTTLVERIMAENDLRAKKLDVNGDLEEHVKELQGLKATATNFGSVITDLEFKVIFLASLGREYNAAVSIVEKSGTFQDAYNTIRLAWLRDTKQRKEEEEKALQVKALLAKANPSKKPRSGKDNGKECWNPTHGTDSLPRKGHTIDECYAEGGGKAGQAPWNKNKGKNTTPVANNITAPSAAVAEDPHVANLALVSSPAQTYILSAHSNPRYIYQDKFGETGEYVETKARLIAQGYDQDYGMASLPLPTATHSPCRAGSFDPILSGGIREEVMVSTIGPDS